MTSLIAYYKQLPNPKLRLFCFHHAGGGASVYRDWQPCFQPLAVEIVPIQLPGRENRLSEPYWLEVSSLLDHVVVELEPYFDCPFAIWGHSMGAMLGYELSMRLQKERIHGQRCLFTSATDAPQLRAEIESTHHLSDNEFITHVRQYGGLPDVILSNNELLEIVLPILRADFELCERYVFKAGEALNCPIFCYGGIQDKTVSHPNLLGWESLTNRAFTFRRFPGDHFYIQSQKQLLLKTLMRDLSSVS